VVVVDKLSSGGPSTLSCSAST
jgi:hypothetical protein